MQYKESNQLSFPFYGNNVNDLDCNNVNDLDCNNVNDLDYTNVHPIHNKDTLVEKSLDKEGRV